MPVDLLTILYIIWFFVLGLIVGSFLNVVIYRLKSKNSFVKGRSRCLHCGHELAVKDLVPLLSFLWLKGKCRYCSKNISWQYFLVELTTGLAFGLVYITITLQIIQLLLYLIISAFLIVIFVYDLKYYLILDKVIWPAAGVALLGNLVLGVSWQSMLLGAVIGGGVFLLQFVASKGKWIGGGDIRLGALMGIILGWKLVLVALFIAYCLGAMVSIFLLIRRKKGFKDQLPFGTFLALATFICLLYGRMILDWYLGLIL